MKYSISCFFCILLLSPICPSFAEMQAKWTPADEEGDGGPLPLSMQQRQELLKLEEAIRSSPDPQSTLVKVAEANQLSPEDLAGMLNRNRQDLDSAGHMGATTVPRPTGSPWQALASLCVAGGKWVKRHPRAAAILGTTVTAGIYVSWDIPQRGLVLSTHKSLFSKGPTTLFAPPRAYLERTIEHIATRPSSVSKSFYRTIDKHLQQEHFAEDGMPCRLDLGRNVRSAATVSSSLTTEGLRGRKFENVDDDIVLEAAWEQGVQMLNLRSLTDFCSSDVKLYMVDEHGILVIRGAGDFSGHALVPLQVVNPAKLTVSDSSVALTFNTVHGAHWDAQMHVRLYLEDDQLHIRVTLLFPKRGPSHSVASGIIRNIHDSMVTSLRTRTRQILARQSQSGRFQKSAQEKADARRATRASKERAIEEMAADRRRRWQRSNPNSGSYRPSGDRMRSPNNAVY